MRISLYIDPIENGTNMNGKYARKLFYALQSLAEKINLIAGWKCNTNKSAVSKISISISKI